MTGKKWPDSGFGARLRELRSESGITMDDLASRVGVSMNTIWRLEKGRHEPLWPFVLALASALGVCVSEFRAERKRD